MRRHSVYKARKKDKVWVEGEQQPNGFIEDIDWHGHEIHVRFHDTRVKGVYSFDRFDGSWTDKFGGVWMLDKDVYLSTKGRNDEEVLEPFPDDVLFDPCPRRRS